MSECTSVDPLALPDPWVPLGNRCNLVTQALKRPCRRVDFNVDAAAVRMVEKMKCLRLQPPVRPIFQVLDRLKSVLKKVVRHLPSLTVDNSLRHNRAKRFRTYQFMICDLMQYTLFYTLIHGMIIGMKCFYLIYLTPMCLFLFCLPFASDLTKP